jgi:hypothetical protein
MTDQSLVAIQRELTELKARVAELEAEAAEAEKPSSQWTRSYYLTYYATTGFFLGMIAAAMSLLFNIVGAHLVGLHPLQLIRVYLTFGLGERALQLQLNDGDGGLTLIIGCCLYLATGMVLGVPFQVVLSRLADRASLAKRLFIASLLAIAVWFANYYLLLSWIQPLLFGGNWILTQIPPWVAVLTHMVFGWAMVLLYPLGRFEPYRAGME